MKKSRLCFLYSKTVNLADDVAFKYPAELSGGMQKRVPLARAITDRVALLYGGNIVWHGPVEGLDRTDNLFSQQFIHCHREGPMQVGH